MTRDVDRLVNAEKEVSKETQGLLLTANLGRVGIWQGGESQGKGHHTKNFNRELNIGNQLNQYQWTEKKL